MFVWKIMTSALTYISLTLNVFYLYQPFNLRHARSKITKIPKFSKIKILKKGMVTLKNVKIVGFRLGWIEQEMKVFSQVWESEPLN